MPWGDKAVRGSLQDWYKFDSDFFAARLRHFPASAQTKSGSARTLSGSVFAGPASAYRSNTWHLETVHSTVNL